MIDRRLREDVRRHAGAGLVDDDPPRGDAQPRAGARVVARSRVAPTALVFGGPLASMPGGFKAQTGALFLIEMLRKKGLRHRRYRTADVYRRRLSGRSATSREGMYDGNAWGAAVRQPRGDPDRLPDRSRRAHSGARTRRPLELISARSSFIAPLLVPRDRRDEMKAAHRRYQGTRRRRRLRRR